MEGININNRDIEAREDIDTTSDIKMFDTTKRFFDIILALSAIILLSPFLIIIAVAVRLDSKGKVIFGHTRLGKDKKEIKIYKFRTMVSNADEVFENFTEEQKQEYYENFKLDNDPRITKVGRFLRKTSLDELPQLLNILKGELSVVGPRPIVQDEVEKYGDCAEKFFSVIPGLTGYWQANGRSDTTYEERIAMDMYYVDNRSLWLDFKIILKTFSSVLRKRGAV